MEFTERQRYYFLMGCSSKIFTKNNCVFWTKGKGRFDYSDNMRRYRESRLRVGIQEVNVSTAAYIYVKGEYPPAHYKRVACQLSSHCINPFHVCWKRKKKYSKIDMTAEEVQREHERRAKSRLLPRCDNSPSCDHPLLHVPPPSYAIPPPCVPPLPDPARKKTENYLKIIEMRKHPS